MKPSKTLIAVVIATSALVTGCATYAPQQQTNYPSHSQPQSQLEGYGTVDSIQITRVNPTSGGAGAVVGGLLGALLANQVGSGSGRTVATVAGAAGGAYVGNEVEKNRAQGHDAYQISIRLDNGDYRTIVQDDVNDLRVGNRVRVIDGRAYRY